MIKLFCTSLGTLTLRLVLLDWKLMMMNHCWFNLHVHILDYSLGLNITRSLILAQCLIISFDQNMPSSYPSWATTNPTRGLGINVTHYKVNSNLIVFIFVISVEATQNVHFIYLNWLYLQDNQILLYKVAYGKVWFNQTITLSGFLCENTKIIL